VSARLQAGLDCSAPETPKPGDSLFERVANVIVAGNVMAVEAAADRARELGFNTCIVTTFLEGEARYVGTFLAGIAREVLAYGRPVPAPACLLFGGETTVTVRGSGTGGRNSELALSAASGIAGLGQRVVVASLATDGGDGASPGAGGIVDGTTALCARQQNLDISGALARNDSYTVLDALGCAITTGPTGTNVNDIMALFVFEPEP
jgi:glycerate-2-kinase